MAESDYLTLTEAEAAFLKAAVDTVIPADDLSPSGSECGVVDFIDCELAGPYGEGARLYRDGPVVKGKPEQGYQLDLTPREFFRQGIAAADVWAQTRFGAAFAALDETQRQAAFTEIDSGTAQFANFEAREFFEFAIADRNGRLFCRSLLRRQSRHGGMEDDRLSRPARRLSACNGTFPREETSAEAAVHRRLRVDQCAAYPPH